MQSYEILLNLLQEIMLALWLVVYLEDQHACPLYKGVCCKSFWTTLVSDSVVLA